MIRAGRDAMSLAQVHVKLGVTIEGARQHLRAAGVTPVNRQPYSPIPGARRPALYDTAQVEAVVNGTPVPPVPTSDAAPHPDDLLDSAEAAEYQGLTHKAFREALHEGRGPIQDEQDEGMVEISDHGVLHFRRSVLSPASERRRGRPRQGDPSPRDQVRDAYYAFVREHGRKPRKAELVRSTGVSRPTVTAVLNQLH